MGNVIEYNRLTLDEVREMYEERRQVFFAEYGTEPQKGESEKLALFRQLFQTDMQAAALGFAGQFGEDPDSSEFSRRRQKREFLQYVNIMRQMDALDKDSRLQTAERLEKLQACEKRIRELEANGEDTSECYFLGKDVNI